jgi:hypothetical protein
MRIKFLQDCELEVVESFDEATDTAETRNEIFKKDEIFEGDVVSETEITIDFQFGDGSVVYGLNTSLFEVLPEKTLAEICFERWLGGRWTAIKEK